jgi:ribonuclease R
MAEKTKIRRLKKGFDYQSDEIRIELDKNLNIARTKVYNETKSHSLIEEAMLLANCCAADMLGDNGIFRVHEKPSPEKIDNLLDTLLPLGIEIKDGVKIHKTIEEIQTKAQELDISKYVDKLIIRAQKKARYDFINVGHFGLGFGSYSHFTSPIRRYSDLLLHRILKAIIKKENKSKNFALKDINLNCQKINDLEKVVSRVEYDFKDRVFARWAYDNIDSEITCIISDNKNGLIASPLDGHMISGARIFIEGSQELELFYQTKVVITKSNILSKKIYGKIV